MFPGFLFDWFRSSCLTNCFLFSFAFCEQAAGLPYEAHEGSFLGVQLLAILIFTAWAGVHAFVIFGGLKMIGWLRISEDEERQGIDESHHGGSAYVFDSKP